MSELDVTETKDTTCDTGRWFRIAAVVSYGYAVFFFCLTIGPYILQQFSYG